MVYLATEAASGYDIVKGFQDTYGYLWNASFQQVYRDLAKLHADGLVDLEIVANSPRPPRNVYRLNDSGWTAMRDWLATPTKAPNINDALLVKLASIHLSDPEVFQQEFAARRDHCRRQLDELSGIDSVFRSVPPDVLEKFGGVHLTLRLGIRQLETWLSWSDDVGRFLAARRWTEITADDATTFNRAIQRANKNSAE